MRENEACERGAVEQTRVAAGGKLIIMNALAQH